jgi:hypothetical protein
MSELTHFNHRGEAHMVDVGDKPSTGNHVEHGKFLGHTNRRVIQAQGVTQDDDRSIQRAAGDRRRHNIGRRHEPVGILVVLVNTEAVIAQRVGILEHVEIVVIDIVAFDRIVELGIDVDPDGTMFLAKVFWQMRPGHEVEPGKFHCCPL